LKFATIDLEIKKTCIILKVNRSSQHMPRKSKLTPEVIDSICDGLEKGNFVSTICSAIKNRLKEHITNGLKKQRPKAHKAYNIN
jgi:hypothetical protein